MPPFATTDSRLRWLLRCTSAAQLPAIQPAGLAAGLGRAAGAATHLDQHDAREARLAPAAQPQLAAPLHYRLALVQVFDVVEHDAAPAEHAAASLSLLSAPARLAAVSAPFRLSTRCLLLGSSCLELGELLGGLCQLAGRQQQAGRAVGGTLRRHPVSHLLQPVGVLPAWAGRQAERVWGDNRMLQRARASTLQQLLCLAPAGLPSTAHLGALVCTCRRGAPPSLGSTNARSTGCPPSCTPGRRSVADRLGTSTARAAPPPLLLPTTAAAKRRLSCSTGASSKSSS